LRWKSFCHIPTALEKWSSTNLADIGIWLELVFYFNLGRLGGFSIILLAFTCMPCIYTAALMTQVAGSLMNNNWGRRLVWWSGVNLTIFSSGFHSFQSDGSEAHCTKN
jgi:hypothetical protein